MTLEEAIQKIKDEYDKPAKGDTWQQKLQSSARRQGISKCLDILALVETKRARNDT